MNIPLTQGKTSSVDKKDFEYLSQWKWYAVFDGYNWYAGRSVKGRILKMHTVIMKPAKGMEIDHANRNGLDNRRINLRISTHQQNSMNRKTRRDNTSGFKGVNWDIIHKYWVARIQTKGVRIVLGQFHSKEEAYEAYYKACIKYHGAYAKP
jgi:hypothetical protein